PKGPLWSQLQRGESVSLEDSSIIKAQQVLGPSRKGRAFGYITDTLYKEEIAESVKEVDLLLCEGMFDSSLEESAKEKKHMTAKQAALVAREAAVASMGLIHYSPRYTDRQLKILLKEAQKVFPNTFLAKDRMSIDLPLKD
ncbi:MAG: MBL fold metallo-hydrolase, partial [Sphaerochaetaceae bacterium]